MAIGCSLHALPAAADGRVRAEHAGRESHSENSAAKSGARIYLAGSGLLLLAGGSAFAYAQNREADRDMEVYRLSRFGAAAFETEIQGRAAFNSPRYGYGFGFPFSTIEPWKGSEQSLPTALRGLGL